MAKVGDIVQAAMWFSVDDTEAKKAIRNAINDCGTVSPITWSTFSPDDGQCPTPPKDAPRGVKLLVGEATLFSIPEPKTFTQSLDEGSLEILRDITQAENLRYNRERLDDEQLDRIINQLAPETIRRSMH